MQASKVRYESPCKCEGVKENVSEQEVGQKVQETLNNINNNVFKSVYSFKFYYYMIKQRKGGPIGLRGGYPWAKI